MSTIREATLIATVLNEADSILPFLDSLAEQTAVPAQIVIVDGGSKDGTADLARSWMPPTGCQLLVVVKHGAGISQGRNIAIDAAVHERILVTDAGTRLDSTWIAAMLDGFEAAGEPDVVAGFFYPTGSSKTQRALAYTITPRLSEIDPETFLPSSRSVAFTKAAWRRAGGYPEWLDYCEDLIFDLNLKRTGGRFVFQPGAQVSWSARPTLPLFMKQYYRYARGDGKAGLFPRRHAIRYSAYAVGVVLAGLAPRRPVAAAILALGASAYLSKFVQRILARRSSFGPGWGRALALMPIIVVAGDIAKMVGYPAGIRWRAQAGRAQR